MTRRSFVRAIAVGTAAVLPAVLLAVQVSLAESSAGASAVAVPTTQARASVLSDGPEPGPVPELSTETSNTVREADGTYTAEISAGPVNYQDDSGDWVPISNELVDAPGSAYAVENEANSYTVSIPANPAATPVKFEEDGAWMTMKMLGTEDAEPEVDGTEAVIEDVAGADEIIYEATDSGVKETIVLDALPTSAPSYAYTLKVSPGITPVLTAEETVEFQDSSSDVAFVIPAGVMEDSAAPEPAFSNAVDYALTQTGSSWRFTVTPSAAWLSDPARVYPVLIDPSVSVDKPDHKDCWLQGDTPNTSRCNADHIRVGKVSGALRRGLLDFGVDSIPSAATIDNAELWLGLAVDQHTGNGGATGFSLYQPKEMWNSTATWNYSGTSSTPWNGGATGAPLSPNSPVMGNSGDGGWKGWNVIETVRRWRSSGSDHIANRGFLVRQQWETVSKSVGFISGTNNQYPTWRPILRIVYSLPTDYEALYNQEAAQAASSPLTVVEGEPPPVEDDGTADKPLSDGDGDDERSPLPYANRRADLFYYPSELYGFNHAHIGIYRWRGVIVESANSTIGTRKISVEERNDDTNGVPASDDVQEATLIAKVTTSSYAVRQAAAQFAGQQDGAEYRNPLYPNRYMTAPFNCSQLVWAAYASEGYDLDEDGGFYVLPRNIVEDTVNVRIYKQVT